MRKSNRIGIIGVGNIMMGDDGVGIAVLERLRNKLAREKIDIIDVGTSGLSLIHALARLNIAIIVDAVDFGGKPGETRCFSPEDARSLKRYSGLSDHECDLLNMIEVSKKLGECPETILIFAIQPSAIVYSTELSPSVRVNLSKFVRDILEVVRRITRGNSSMGEVRDHVSWNTTI